MTGIEKRALEALKSRREKDLQRRSNFAFTGLEDVSAPSKVPKAKAAAALFAGGVSLFGNAAGKVAAQQKKVSVASKVPSASTASPKHAEDPPFILPSTTPSPLGRKRQRAYSDSLSPDGLDEMRNQLSQDRKVIFVH